MELQSEFRPLSKFRKSALYCHTFIYRLDLPLVHSFFQSQFSTGSDLVLPLSNSIIFSFPQGDTVAAYVFFLLFTSFQYCSQ